MRRKGDHVGRLSVSPCERKTGWLLVSNQFLHSSSVVFSSFLSQCFGKSPDGKDFEAHIGAEKAREIKALFADWIDTMYRTPPLTP